MILLVFVYSIVTLIALMRQGAGENWWVCGNSLRIWVNGD